MPLDDGTQLAKLLGPFYEQLLAQAFDSAGLALDTDVSFDLANPRVQDVLGQLAKSVKGVAETTKEEIRALVGQAADEGWSSADLAQRIREHGVTSSKSRSEMIARTETALAYQAGSHLAYAESSVVQGTEWLLGSEPCDVCQPLGGKIVPLGEHFAEGTLYPPLHPRCTCATAPILKDAS